MAGRRSGGSHKGVEEKRRNLPIYQHYTLSPGKTKSHHPEAKCNHCLKEFVCGSKQRLIRHLRKCPSVTNSSQVITETLNTLEATGKLNHSVLEASNLLPSQLSQYQLPNNHNHSQQHQIATQQVHHSSASSTTIANSNALNTNNINGNHNNSGVVPTHNDNSGLIASSSNGTQLSASVNPVRRAQRRGRKSGVNSSNSSVPSIHVTHGIDGKMHFTAAPELPHNIAGTVGAPIIAQVHTGGRSVGGYTYTTAVPTTASSGAHLSTNSGHLSCANSEHHPTPLKLNTEVVDKAYLKLVLTRNLPLSLCDSKEFQSWIKTFTNDYRPPSSINIIKNNLKIEAQTARQRVSNILAKASKKTINLELHNWASDARNHRWYAVIANLDHKRFLISVRNAGYSGPHAASQIEGSTPEKVLEGFIDDCVKRVGSDRINSLVLADADVALAVRVQELIDSTHPSIVLYNCWWHFSNLLCSDFVERIEVFQHTLRNSVRVVDFINDRHISLPELETFSPFVGLVNNRKRNDKRWFSHLVCYLLQYVKNNREALIKAIDVPSAQSQIPSDNNNNSSGASNDVLTGLGNLNSSTQPHIVLPNHHEVKSILMSSEYWTNLDLALFYLKPFHELSALKLPSTTQNANNQNTSIQATLVHQITPMASATTANSLPLSDYMHWLLNFGKSLLESWKQEPSPIKYQVIKQFLQRINLNWPKFKLLFAAYLLNPKYRCAYITQEAKEMAILEILNIASEFMPEESDGHTIFDQWKLYLVREEPYDTVFDENRSTPLEWWLSLPCAESIRRVALRILRLKAFTAPKPVTLFSQLHHYEDETKSPIDHSTYEDLAVLRYFYDYEDKVGAANSPSHNHLCLSNTAIASNGALDRTDVGELHNTPQPGTPTKLLISGYDSLDANCHTTESYQSGDQSFSNSYPEVVYGSNNSGDGAMGSITNSRSLSIEDLPGYDMFIKYINYNELGVQVIEEPIEKKRRKWTAQEILSKSQSNHQNNNTAKLE